MFTKQTKTQPSFRWLAALLALSLVISMSPALRTSAYGAEKAASSSLTKEKPEILVTGDKIIGADAYTAANIGMEKAYTRKEMKAMEGGTNVSYSALNTSGTPSMYRASGVYLTSLLKGTAFDAAKDKLTLKASDGYAVSFDPAAKYENGARNTTGLNEKRSFYPNLLSGGTGGAAAVKTMLSWASRSSKTELPASAGAEQNSCTVMTGQLSAEDQNNPLYNKSMQKIVGGKELSKTVLTVDSKEYARGDILLMDRAEKAYTYLGQGGAVTDYVRGVPISVLLAGADPDSKVAFEAADGYPVKATNMTVKELIDADFILAYEKGTKAADLKAVFETAKTDSSIQGYFTLYGDGDAGKPAKMISKISVLGSSGVDFAKSPYKHITNGGNANADGPYNIDGITGATLTIEGPGVKSSVPLSVRDLEGQNNGAFRGDYTDTRSGKAAERTYEGIDLYYILHNMSSGTTGISLTDKAKKVQIKDRNRKTTAAFTLDQIKALHDKGRPVLVAYGTSNTDGSNPRPFVFDNAPGQDLTLGNADGCLKLVYDRSANTGDLNTGYTQFKNMAYIYVEEETAPGFKHDKAPYKTAENSQYVLTVTGKEIGREVNYTVQQLEDMVKYDSTGAPEKGGVGYRDEYSLANSAYWYVNEYEGVKLWDLLQMSGLEPGRAADSTTKVKFSAADGYTAFDTFTLKQIADPDAFGFYEKNAADLGDGKYVPQASDLKKKGYPVLVAYGVNGYPYVIKNTLDGYLSGLANDGGPLRVISGKTDYSHANGSNQAKLLDKILAGDDTYHYSTHKYHEKDVYKKQAEQKLDIKILNGAEADAPVMKETSFNVGEIEDLIYGGKLSNSQLKDAKVKAFYEIKKGENFYNDLYEGVNLNFFLKNIVQLPGEKGTVTFSNGTDAVKMNLQDVLKMANGYNTTTDLEGLSPVLAYGKNGAPMVASKNAEDGYEDTVSLGSGSLAGEFTVKNSGGPLSIIVPNSSKTAKDAQSVSNVTSITVNLSPDHYAHMKAPYDTYKDRKIKVSGEGTRLTGTREFTVGELEENQTLAVTGDYSILKSGAASASQQRFRGISLYEFLNSGAVGLKNSADKVKITCSDGSTGEFSLSEVRKTNYINSVTKADNLQMILAYGSAAVTNKDREDGRPLVKDSSSKGYDAAYSNSGGPLKLVVGQENAKDANSAKILKDVTAIEVTAGTMTSWNHSSSEIFKQYLTDTVELSVIDQEGKSVFSKKYTVGQLEKMTDLIEREEITGTAVNTWEGINMWDFVLQETAAISGMDDLISVNVTAKDGFTKDLLSIFGKDELENGIKDGERRVPILLAYGMDGYPLSSGSKSNPNGEGYDSTVGNNGGPIRLMTHGNQGSCLQEANKITVKIKEGAAAPKPVKFNVIPADGTQLPKDVGVRSIKFDENGGMWVGTYGGGAAYKAKGADKFVIYDKGSSPALETGFVSALAPDKDGGVWLSQNASYTNPADNRGVVYLKDGKMTAFRASDSPATIPDDYVQDIKIDDTGCVWFASFGGVTKYDPAAKTWKTWNKDDGFPAMSADKIEFDGNGGAWIGFYPDGDGEQTAFTGGFAHLDRDGKITAYPQKAETKLADVWVRDIAVGNDGTAWITASGAYANLENTGGTLWQVKPGAEPVKYTGDGLFGKALNGAENAEIRMVEADSKGGLWFGTSADGIFHVEKPVPNENGAFTLTAEYSKETGSWSDPLLNNIYSLDVRGSEVYAGTSGGAVWVDCSAKDNTKLINGVKNTSVRLTAAAKASQTTLKWTQSKGYKVDKFQIYRKTASAGSYTLLGTAKTGDVRTYTDKKVRTGTKYSYKVRGVRVIDGKNVYTKWSNVSTAVGHYPVYIKNGVQKTKMYIRTGVSKGKVTVKWSQSTGFCMDRYQVYRSAKKTAGTFKPVYTSKTNKARTFTDKKVKKGQRYYYKVRGYRLVDGKRVYSKWSKTVCRTAR